MLVTGCGGGSYSPAPSAPALTAEIRPAQAPGEEGAARFLESIRGDAAELLLFLREMPKGGDLHTHLSGAIYAESYIAWAAEDGVCIALAELALAHGPCDPGAGLPPATEALRDPALHDALVDALSVRNWNPLERSGHSQFFGTFPRFDAAQGGRVGDMLAEAAARAALGRVSYLELMLTADGRASRELGARIGWMEDREALRTALLEQGMEEVVAVARRNLDAWEGRMRERFHCGTPSASSGCDVTLRYLYSVSRARPPEQVFAQILTGFELASRDPRVVGLNLVQPEDQYLAMRDYSLHMRVIGELRPHYPGVGVALHAGELAPGLVPPEGLRFHIREAVEVAGAQRIGHGVAVMHEADAEELLATMAEGRVLVEILLSSNDIILGVSGEDHPLHAYLRRGVPVALATDDEGVARSEMTMEFLRAVREQRLDYPTLKTMVRNSLEFSFLEGESLWEDSRTFLPIPPCRGGGKGTAFATPACERRVAESPRASLQRKLELELAAFEARYR
jgi:adenosine deaminase